MNKKEHDYDLLKREHPTWEFPEFTADVYKKKRTKYCVCVFVINEGKKVQKQLVKMGAFSDKVDIIVADGGSTDGSLDADFLSTTETRALLTKTGAGKLSSQMRMAFAWALHEGYEGLVIVDGNGKDDISAIVDFVKMLDSGYDHVQGSRFIKGGKAVNTPISRLLALKLIHAPMLSLASGKRHTDTTNGFRAYSRRLLVDEDIAIFRDKFMTYELHYYLTVESSRRKQYKTIEIPVTRVYPKGKTPTKISPIKGNIRVIIVLVKVALGKYKK